MAKLSRWAWISLAVALTLLLLGIVYGSWLNVVAGGAWLVAWAITAKHRMAQP